MGDEWITKSKDRRLWRLLKENAMRDVRKTKKQKKTTETENLANLTSDDRDAKKRTTSNIMPSYSSSTIKTIQYTLPILAALGTHEVHNYEKEH